MGMYNYVSKIVDSIEKNFCAETVEVKFDRENGKIVLTLDLHPECNPELKNEEEKP